MRLHLRLLRFTPLMFALLCGSFSIACTKQIPPPPPPARSLPVTAENEDDSLDTDRTPHTTLVTIASDVPAKVERSMGIDQIPTRTRVRHKHIWETICASTPCSVRIPQGETILRFTGVKDSGRESITTINVGAKRAVINHTLGQERGSVGSYVGVGLIIVGLAALIFPYGFDLDQPKAAPSAFVVGGIASIFGGLTLMGFDPAIKQRGATTAWTPSAGGQEPQQQLPAPAPASSGSQSSILPTIHGAGLGFAF